MSKSQPNPCPLNSLKLFDCHCHIIDPAYPLQANNGYIPNTFTCSDYLRRLKNFRLIGGAIVSGSFQGFDQSYLKAALNTLGPNFVGVTQLPFDTSDNEILELNSCGVRALRFNLFRGGSEKTEYLLSMGQRVFELAGWHTELYIDFIDLEDIESILLQLPAASIDHLGISRAGFKALLKLAEKGVMIKATGFGRTDLAIAKAIKSLYSANPDALMFGTDLPSTRAKIPFQDEDFITVLEALDEQKARKVFSENALDFYRPASKTPAER